MSFLSGFLGGGKADSMVDQAVDKVAVVAKSKVKEMMGGGAADGAAADGAAAGAAAGAAGAGGQAPAAGGGADIGGVAAGAMDAFSGMFGGDDKKEKKPSTAGGALDLADSLDF